MPVVRIEHSVPDFEAWKQVFDQDPADRRGSGVRRYAVLRAQDDPNFVMIDLEFDTLEEAEAFLSTMKRIWAGPGKAVMLGPQARIAEVVEAREV
jgi:hypothetical protein